MVLKIFLASLFAFILFYSIFIEPFLLFKTYIDLKFGNLPVPSFKIVQISDIHYTRMSRQLMLSLKVIEKEKPDIVVITGDFINSSLKINFQEYLKKVYEINPNVYAVLGNWDHNVYDINPLKEAIIKSGVNLIVNSNLTLQNGIVLAGTDDPYFDYDDLGKTFENINKNDFVVLLSHTPDIIYEALKYDPEIILSGHLHGGQVCIPFTKISFYVPSDYGSRFLKGLYQIDGTYLIVNRGLGTSHLRVRFFSPPEITIINLSKN